MTISSALPVQRPEKRTTVIGSQTITHSLCAEASSRISKTWLPFYFISFSPHCIDKTEKEMKTYLGIEGELGCFAFIHF
jgi:hypothetical protein